MIDVTIHEIRLADGSIKTFSLTIDPLRAGETRDSITYTFDAPNLRAARGLAMAAYEARCIISSDTEDITADGLDAATITVTSNQTVAEIVLRCEAINPDTGAVVQTLTRTVAIAAGLGSIQLTSSNPADLRITPDDRSLYTASGRGQTLVRARA